MNIEKQLETAVKTNHLVLVVFYADWSPHYEWIGPVLRTYEKRTVELIRVNAEENRAIADAHNVETVPAFLLLEWHTHVGRASQPSGGRRFLSLWRSPRGDDDTCGS